MLPTRIVSSLLFLAAMTVGARAYSDKVVREWNAYCDDQLSCHMQGRPEGEGIYVIEFAREASANAPITFTLSHRGVLSETGSIIFSVPGQLERFELPVASGTFENGIWRFFVPAIGERLVPAMQAGSTMDVSISTDEGQFTETASLSGASAIMRWVDEQQDRVNKLDALIAKGDLPATGRTTRSSRVNASAEVPDAVLARWRDPVDDCSLGREDEDLIASLGGFRLAIDENPAVSVYILPCGSPGAYNLIHAGYVHDSETGDAKPLAFPTMFDTGPGVTTTIINGGWDENAGQLQAFAKGRGLGDCGTASSWEWSGSGIWGSFVLVEERSKEDCDEDFDTPWPLVWPVR